MMYCALAELEARMPKEFLVQLTDDENPGSEGAVNEDVIGEAIEESSALIDSMICGRYKLPFTEVPPVLKGICADLSIYKLHERRLALDDNPGMRKRYDNAMKLLQMIADGTISLAAPIDENGAFSAKSMVAGGPARFTMDSMRSL